MAEEQFTIHLEQEQGYDFRVRFDIDQAETLLMDEPEPLGADHGPNASRLLTAAAANCLSASLMFCLAKADVPNNSIRTEATCTLGRNDKNRLRIARIDVSISAGDELLGSKKLNRCLELFEDFCVVTASLREGVEVGVKVLNENGELIHQAE